MNTLSQKVSQQSLSDVASYPRTENLTALLWKPANLKGRFVGQVNNFQQLRGECTAKVYRMYICKLKWLLFKYFNLYSRFILRGRWIPVAIMSVSVLIPLNTQ
jgi:hypothetical protein